MDNSARPTTLQTMTERSLKSRLDGRKIVVAWMVAFFLGGVAGVAGTYVFRPRPVAQDFSSTLEGHLLRLDRNAAPGRVVFLGSSTFQGLDTSRVTPIGLNLAIGGDRLNDLTRRAQQYRSLKSARAIVLNGGLNDLVRQCALPATGIEVLFGSIPGDIPVIVLGIQGIALPQRPIKCAATFPTMVRGFNERSATACAIRPLCRFVPNPVPADVDSHGAKAWQEPDGIHLSSAGYDAVVERLAQTLQDLKTMRSSHE